MPTEIVLLMLVLLLVMIVMGVHIVLALGFASVIGTYLVLGNNLNAAMSLLGSSAFEVLRDYVFAIIPLFVLMGDFVARSGAATDIYKLVNRVLRRVPGRLGVATVAGNAIFAAVTGVSLASAAAFTRIAYPEMVRFGYNKTNSVGVIAGSACLGMLIPPSVLLIIWGILTETSIGKLFVAGILPGIVLAGLFALYVIGSAIHRPENWGHGKSSLGAAEDERLSGFEWIGALGTASLIVLVLGGIWGGVFTPTEAAGMGALGALFMAVAKGMRYREILHAVYEAGRTSAPILILLIVAAMYARLLALGGVVNFIEGLFGEHLDNAWVVLLVMLVVWLLLGMLLDSASILLVTVPIFVPIAMSFGWEPYAFAIIGVLAVEAGILTPPFGLLVFAVKGFLEDKSVTLGQIFLGSTPYWIIILLTILLVAVFPALGEYLPSLM